MHKEEREGADLLTFGEAAEYAGVPLLELRAQLRGLSAPAQWGWRGGVAVQLVPLEVLEALYPVLKQRKRKLGPSLAERGIHLVAPAHLAGGLPGKAAHAGSGIPLPARPSSDLPSRRSKRSGRAGGQPAEKKPATNSAAKDPELAGLYREMEDAAVRNEALLRELTQAGEGLDQLLETVNAQRVSESQRTNVPSGKRVPVALQVQETDSFASEDALARTAEWNRLMREQGAIEKRQRYVQWTSWSIAALMVVLFLFKGQDWLGNSGDQEVRPLPGQDPERVAQGEPSPASQPTEVAMWGNPLIDDKAQSIPHEIDPSVSNSERPSLVPFEQAVAAPNLVSDRDWATPGLPNVDGQITEAAWQGTAQEATSPNEVGAGATSGQPLEASFALSSNPANSKPANPQSGLTMLPLVTSEDPACYYGPLTAKAQPLRNVLGPCIGPWNPDEKMVAGGFRFGGHRLCRHHQAFQKEFGGSVERAKQVAEYAQQEGIVPPLVRLRVEHGASQLLQARLGRWVESGFEAGLSKTHRVKADKQEGRWNVHSWVRLRLPPGEAGNGGDEPAPETELRHFVMSLEIDAEQGRDRLLEFVWSGEE